MPAKTNKCATCEQNGGKYCRHDGKSFYEDANDRNECNVYVEIPPWKKPS